MASKYEVLSALVDAQADQWGDDAGWHHTIVGVINQISTSHGSEEALADSIYDLIADSAVASDDEANPADAPGSV